MTIGTQAVTLQREGAIGIVRMKRAHGNAIDDDLVEGLMSTLAEAEADGEIRGVMLASSGKIFCPGLDLQVLLPLDRPAMERFMLRFSAAVLTLYTFPKPVVASLHGHALAGGCILGLCADWRVLARGALVGLNEVKIGVPLPFGVALIVRDAVPKNFLTQVALLGRNVSDQAAVTAGVADELADAADVEATSRTRLDELVAKDPPSFAVTKRYLRSPVVERFRANNRLLLAEWLDCWFAADTRRRIGGIVAELRAKGEKGKA